MTPDSGTVTTPGSSLLQDEKKLRDVRKLLTQIVAHEGHESVEVCVSLMVETAKTALVVIDSERWGK